MNDNTIIKNSGILYVRLFLTTAISLVSTRMLLEALGMSDYVLYAIVEGIVGIMGFLNTVMISTTHRFIAYELGKGDENEICEVFNTSRLIHIGLGLLLIILSETVGLYYINNYLNLTTGNVEDAIFVFRFSVWGTFLMIITIPYQGLITAASISKFKPRLAISGYHNDVDLWEIPLLIKKINPEYKVYYEYHLPINWEACIFAT